MTAHYHLSNGVGRLTIHRPEVRNALNEATVAALTKQLHEANLDPQCKVILLSGSGNKAFCAGADLAELDAKGALDERTEFFEGVATLVRTISEVQKPVIAKVHGAAVAGGMGLVAASDIVLASEDATFALPEVRLGLAPLIVMTPLERSLPRKVLADLALTGDPLTASRAYDLGFISRIYPVANLDHEADLLAARLASMSTEALSLIKRSLYDISEGSYFPLLGELPSRIAALSITEGAQSGVRGFLSRHRSKAQ